MLYEVITDQPATDKQQEEVRTTLDTLGTLLELQASMRADIERLQGQLNTSDNAVEKKELQSKA